MHKRQRLCFVKSCDKEMFLFIYAASGPLHYSLHLHRALDNNAGLGGLTAKCLPQRIVIKYQLCVKTNSCGFNCKPDNKNRNPENV